MSNALLMMTGTGLFALLVGALWRVASRGRAHPGGSAARWLTDLTSKAGRTAKWVASGASLVLMGATPAFSQQPGQEAAAGEANLKVPDLSQATFLGTDGHKLLL